MGVHATVSGVLLAGASAVVSGVGPGLGRSISVAFAREGASVTLGARTTSTLERVGGEVIAGGGRAGWSRTHINAAQHRMAFVGTAAEAFIGVGAPSYSRH